MIVKIIDRILVFLDKHLPSFLAGVFLGSHKGKVLARKAKTRIFELKFKLRRLQDEKAIKARNSRLTDSELKAKLLAGGLEDMSESSGSRSGDKPE